MDDLIPILVLISMLWTITALCVQVISARGRGRHDFSERAGSTWRGALYAFTTSMTPAHKESLRLHRVEFAVGLIMHFGVALSIIEIILLLARAESAFAIVAYAWPLLAVAIITGAVLFVRRLGSTVLRAMSAPDDYLANFATIGLITCALIAATAGEVGRTILLIYAIPFFVYLPLGKLRHAVFFFVARGDFGRRLGYRGVYPQRAVRTEQANA